MRGALFTITGFADEIAHDLDEQISLLNKLKINHVEFRSAWGAKVLDLTEEQLAEAKAKLDAAGISLSAVGSDLGKINITDPFEDHLERARHGVEVAKLFGAKYIRMFSFFIAEGDNPKASAKKYSPAPTQWSNSQKPAASPSSTKMKRESTATPRSA